MDRCWLVGSTGDALHAVLCAAGFNIRWLLRAIAAKGLVALLLAFSRLALCAPCIGNLLQVPTPASDPPDRRGSRGGACGSRQVCKRREDPFAGPTIESDLQKCQDPHQSQQLAVRTAMVRTPGTIPVGIGHWESWSPADGHRRLLSHPPGHDGQFAILKCKGSVCGLGFGSSNAEIVPRLSKRVVCLSA